MVCIASWMGLYFIHWFWVQVILYIYTYKSGLHNNTTVVLYIHLCIPRPHHIHGSAIYNTSASNCAGFFRYFLSTSQCRPRPAKGSLPAVCVHKTKTLHAQHIDHTPGSTCVFPKRLTVTSIANTANNSASESTIPHY